MSTSTKVRPAINRKRAEALLREVVAGREDHIDPNALGYVGCKYFERGHRKTKGSCIVGSVLVASGVELPFGARSHLNDSAVGYVAEKFPQLFTEGALKVLTTAQKLQDRGRTWGEIKREVLSHKKGRV